MLHKNAIKPFVAICCGFLYHFDSSINSSHVVCKKRVRRGAGYSNKIAIQYHLSGYMFICRYIFGEVARVGIVLETSLCSSSLRDMKHPTPTPVR